jgi:hypothetical protein
MPNVPRDVASPLQNWYSTEFNPGASVTGSLFGGTAGGMTPNTGVKPVTTPITTVIPTTTTTGTAVTGSPLYTSLTNKSTPVDVATAYADFIAKAGGNTAANRQAATDYLTNLGLTQGQIESSYSAYLNTLPAAGNTYQQLNAKATPSNVAQAYSSFVGGAGGDTAANQATAINYLKDIGLTDDQISTAYNTYLSSTKTETSQPSYTTLAAGSSPTDIASAYRDFITSSGGDTAANQQAAVEYLTGLGIGQDTIGSAYGLFKGA